MRALLSLFLSISLFSCVKDSKSSVITNDFSTEVPLKTELKTPKVVINGDAQLSKYEDLIKDKKVGLIVNQSSIIGKTHLIDTLLATKHTILKIFAPEHGIRGKADAGEKVTDGIDTKTGIQIISLYGSHKKPTAEDLEGIEIMIFDLQDVGVRFYTYISTMHYVMEACAENNIPIIILDRPNPNGDYVAGPVLDMQYQSFVGMHAIPIVHGLTVGELAQMINGESWLSENLKANVTVIKCKHYTHDSIIPLKIKPSPNLPNLNSIRWYPTLCLFEPTKISIGRGTYTPFEIYGSPEFDSSMFNYSFTPKGIEGMSKFPKHQNKTCYGINLINTPNNGSFSYDILVDIYKKYSLNNTDFMTSKNFFHKLCGTDKVWIGLQKGLSSEELEKQFKTDLGDYKTLRKKYLLYPDFNER